MVISCNALMECSQSHSTERAEKCSDGGIPATWGEREEEEKEGGRPWALQNGGFLPRRPHPPLPRPPALREEAVWWKGTEEEKRMDQKVPRQTGVRGKGKEKGQQRRFKERAIANTHRNLLAIRYRKQRSWQQNG